MAPPSERAAPVALHLRPAALAQVAVGGSCGAAAREAIEQAWPAGAGGLPWATLAINLAGALLLGALLEALVRAGDDRGARLRARLVVGTGFLGAFTTYSTFAVESDLLGADGHGPVALAYVLLTVLAGLVAAGVGIAIGAGRARRRRARTVGADVDSDTGRAPGPGAGS